MNKIVSALILIGLLGYAMFMPVPLYDDVYRLIGRITGAVIIWGVIVLLSNRGKKKENQNEEKRIA